MCPDTYADDHTSRLEPQIIVMRSNFPSRITGRDILPRYPDLVIFEGRDVYVCVHEHNLNVNAVVAAYYCALTPTLITTHHVWNLKSSP